MELPPSQANCGPISGDDLNIIDSDSAPTQYCASDHEEQLIFFQGMDMIFVIFHVWAVFMYR